MSGDCNQKAVERIIEIEERRNLFHSIAGAPGFLNYIIRDIM